MISVVSAYCGLIEMTNRFLDNLKDKLPSDYELILVNAGSTPIEHEVITKRIDLPENKSFANSMNAGIKAAKGDYIIIIGNDVFPDYDEWINELELYAYNDAGIIAPTFDYPTMKDYKDKIIEEYDYHNEMSFYPAVCWLIPRKIINEVGLFDERFELGCFEDNDYAKRVRDKGYKIIVVKETFLEMKHLGGATMKTLCDVKETHDTNMKRYKEKWSSSQ